MPVPIALAVLSMVPTVQTVTTFREELRIVVGDLVVAIMVMTVAGVNGAAEGVRADVREGLGIA